MPRHDKHFHDNRLHYIPNRGLPFYQSRGAWWSGSILRRACKTSELSTFKLASASDSTHATCESAIVENDKGLPYQKGNCLLLGMSPLTGQARIGNVIQLRFLGQFMLFRKIAMVDQQDIKDCFMLFDGSNANWNQIAI